MHVCSLRDILSEEECEFLHNLVSGALEEATEVLAIHEGEPPPMFEVSTTGEAAEAYSNLVAMQKRRIVALEHMKALAGEVKK